MGFMGRGSWDVSSDGLWCERSGFESVGIIMLVAPGLSWLPDGLGLESS